MPKTDIAICWASVHGGRYHALLHLQERLRGQGLCCSVFLNSDAPLGMQEGCDVTPGQVARLAELGVRILPLSDMARAIGEEKPRLCLVDAHDGEATPRLIHAARAAGALTVQTSTLLADYSCHGADYALVQHPISLWIALEYSRVPGARNLAKAKGVFFSGNIFYEPLLNTWTSGVASREELCARYGLDAQKPLALWLPNREDGQNPDYGRIIEAAREAGMNVLVKLHPWEYKQLRHGFDPYGEGKTSAEKWGVPAMEERDTSWALKFCDAGLMRGSSLGLELPFWGAPGVYLPYPGVHQPWYALLLQMTRGVCAHLERVEDLAPLLARGLPRPDAAAIARAKAYTMPKGAGGPGQPDSLDLHVRHLLAILGGSADKEAACTPGGSLSALRRAFEPDIPSSFYRCLRLRQRISHAARALLGL